MNKRMMWYKVLLLCVLFTLAGWTSSVQARDTGTGLDNPELANHGLRGLEARTMDEVLALPEAEIDLVTAILILSREVYHDLYQTTIDVEHYRTQIDEMSHTLLNRIGTTKEPEQIIATLNKYFFRDLEFASIGEEEPGASFLNFVLDENGGNCVGLSMLYLGIAERIGLPLFGVSAPGHFFVRYEDSQNRINIDPSLGGASYPDDEYMGEFNIPEGSQLYLISLSKKEAIGVYISNRGGAYAQQGFLDQAISDLTKAIELDPRCAESYFNRGNAYGEKGLYDQAIADYSKAIEIDPRCASAYANRGVAYRQKGLLDQAVADYSKAIEIDPEYAIAYYNRGIAYERKGLYDQAIADYTRALEIDPEDASTYNNRGIAYYSQGRYDQAIADFTRALEIDPRFAKVYFNKALACENAGRFKEAIEAYQGFIQHAPAEYATYIESARQRIRELGE